MSGRLDAPQRACEQADLVYAYALEAIPASERPAVEAHVAKCDQCRSELEALRPVREALVEWPMDVLQPSVDVWTRIADRIGAPFDEEPALGDAPRQWQEPEWQQVAPDISCKILATDLDRDVVSMLVRLAPGGEYPPHRHAGVEELHLLDGELWINDRKLHPGDYNRAEVGTSDARVWSETGCTCLLITSMRDELL